jgi:general secretion pathway protein F
MSTFTYNALNTLGHSITGELVADDERAALRELTSRGLTPLSLSVAMQVTTRGLRWRKRGSLEDHIRLINELAVLIGAGVNLSEAVNIASRSPVHAVFGDGLNGVGRDLRRGERVTDAIQNNIKTFPPYVYQLIRAGDETGLLANALKDACQQMQFDDRVRKDIRHALVYPLFLLAMGGAATLFIFLIVVPRFAAMLKDRMELLPVFSRSLFQIGLFVQANVLPVVAVLIVLVLGLVALSREPSFQNRLRELVARAPVLGKFVVEAEAGRWTAMLAILLQNRVPLVHSLNIARESLRLESFKVRLDQVERGVRNGNALAAALEDYRLFDEALVNLIRVGERSGRLAEMLQSAAALAEQKGRDRIKRMMALLEPLSIVVIGGMIGTIVIALFTAIASINNVPL